ncbi:MAG TPA: hypothetical protein VIY48_08310 [Candidatus Paceibacterota bacterium]
MQNNLFLAKLLAYADELKSMSPHADTFEAAQAYHATLKADPVQWQSLTYVGPQEIDEESHLELRNCPCGSTIAKLVSGPACK